MPLRSLKFLLTAALAASLGTVALAAIPAAAAPVAPVISQVVTSAGTFATSPSAGTNSTPVVTVTGVASGDTVNLYTNGGPNPAAVCVATATTVVFNGASTGCQASAPYNVGPTDGSFTITATRTDLTGTSPASNGFVYYKDTVAPPAPAAISTTQIVNDGLRVQWAKATEASGSGVTQYFVYRSAADQADPTVEGTYTKIAAVTEASCAGAGNQACTYDDIPPNGSTDPIDGKHYFYKVSSVDLAANEGSKSASSPSAAPGIVPVVVPPPSITSVGGSTSSPTFQPDGTQTKPDVVIAVGTVAGTVTLQSDGVAVASKTVAGSSVTLHAADFLTGKTLAPRSHALTAVQTVSTHTSPASATFTYVLPPAKPVITSVSGQTTSPAKAAATQPTVAVSWVGSATNDRVTLYLDDDCAGPHAPAAVAEKTNVIGTTTSFVGLAGDWGSTQLAAGHTYCLSVINTDTTITDVPTSASPTSDTFQFERAPIVSGYLLDGRGSITSINGAPAASGAPAFGFDIARRMVMAPTGGGAYVMDGYGGIYAITPTGATTPPPLTGAPYFGFDIARDLVFTSATQGYVLDGYGGIHPFGGAAPVSNGPYFGWDIARRIVLLPSGTAGYLLDGYGGIHRFSMGSAAKPPALSGSPYFGFDIARDIDLVTATSGYVLDGFGGVHPFGGTAAVTVAHYTQGADLHRSLVLTETDNDGGYVLDSFGRVSTFGDSVTIPRPLTLPNPTARDIVMTTQ